MSRIRIFYRNGKPCFVSQHYIPFNLLAAEQQDNIVRSMFTEYYSFPWTYDIEDKLKLIFQRLNISVLVNELKPKGRYVLNPRDRDFFEAAVRHDIYKSLR